MDSMFNNVDFGPLKKYLDDDDITDVSYSNNGQLWLKSLSKGVYKPEIQDVNNAHIEKLAFQCANMMGKTFNMAHPFLDAESAELRLNFVHDSIARNGIALLMRKTPAKIRLQKDKIIAEKYITETIHDFLLKCVEGHCNIIISGETGSGKTEFLKYLAAHTKENEKLITIEDTLELHLDKIFPYRDIIAMKTNNIASYTDVLVTCMRQNPKWILLSEVRSAEAVMAVRNSISSGHYILSTIHADKAESIPNRMYSLLETNLDIDQFLKSVYRYIQLGVHIRGYQDKNTKRFVREVCEVCEFYVDEDNNPKSNVIYRKTATGQVHMKNPSKYLLDYLAGQGVILSPTIITGSEEEIEKQEDNNMASSIESAKATNVVANPMTDVAKPIVQPKSVVNTTQVVQPTVSTQPVQQAPVQNIVDTQTQSVQQSTPVNNIFKNTETLNI
ncbi:MAG: CpaF/VirB11 family protein [bacterium]|nr:CpaF/VirB11 family protein [bacterium]MDY4109020.1 CpaF/VirB11 family protein [Bacilli bacterium]